MSQVSSLDKNDGLLSAKEAASISTYTPSYVARLAKSGKVLAIQKKGKWLVDARSFEKYLESSRQRRRNDAKTRNFIVQRPIDKVAYSAAWTFNQASSGPFNVKSLLESLAIAGCSVLVGMLFYGMAMSDMSTVSLYDGGKEIAYEVRDRYVASVDEISHIAAAISVWQEER